MANQVVNVLIAAVIGAVAYIAVKALVVGASVEPCGDNLAMFNTTENITRAITGDCGTVVCTFAAGADANTTNCTYGGTIYEMNATIDSGYECWTTAECTMFGTILPLAVAIGVIAMLFFGLTRVRGA